jgi:hypothetical protein
MSLGALRTHGRTRLAWLLVAAGTAVLVARAVVAERQTVDDLFIFLRYARNLAERAEFAFNPGERVEGTSSVAWTVALAGAWKLGLRGAGVAKAMSLATAALIPSACALALRPMPTPPGGQGGLMKDRTWEGPSLAMAVPALALAFDADLATWASSGMDTAPWTLACVACVAMVAAGRDHVAAFALGALAWVRPEGALFAAFGVLALATDRRSVVRLACLAAVPLVALTLLRLVYFHELLPNTFWAKMNAADGKDYTGVGYVASALERRPLLLLLLPLGGYLPGFARPKARTPRPVRVALALLAASLVFALVAGGDWMPNRRLLVVALPLAAVTGAVAVARIRTRALSLAVCVALVAEAALTFDHAVDQRWRSIEWLDGRVADWHPVARPFAVPYALDWMPTHLLREIAPFVAPGDVVAHVDVGELPYVMGDLAFLDGFGLVDRGAGRLAFSSDDPSLRALVRESFFARRPAVAIVVLGDRGRPLSPAQDAAMQDARFAAGWQEVGRVPTWGGHPCVTYARRDVRPAPADVSNARVQGWLASVPDVAPAF